MVKVRFLPIIRRRRRRSDDANGQAGNDPISDVPDRKAAPESGQAGNDPFADIGKLLHNLSMTTYAPLDPIIDAWARVTVKELMTEWADRPARVAYLPGLRPFECFQISIEQPLNGRVAVLARSVDTDDESEFEQRWEGPTTTLSLMLDTATNTVQRWVSRAPASGG